MEAHETDGADVSSCELLIGCAGNGALHHDGLPVPSVDESFRLVKASSAFSYYDKFPARNELPRYRAAADAHGLPILAGTAGYDGGEEDLLRVNLEAAALLGSCIHNIVLFARLPTGAQLCDADVADFYLRAAEHGQRCGVEPSMEVHVDTWAEDFRRVEAVADIVQSHGATLNITLDCSHVLFKIGNEKELAISDLLEDVRRDRIRLDPWAPGNVFERWLARGLVRHVHARAAAMNNPPNVWYTFEDGSHGRGIQYPFLRPAPGEWHSQWQDVMLEPFKQVMRSVLADATRPDSRVRTISTEYIAKPHYGAGARYSMLDNNIACARWLNDEWAAALSRARDEQAVPA